MANTKNLTRAKRKSAKRTARSKLKAAWGSLTRRQRRQFVKGDEKSLKKYLASIKPKEEEKPPEAPPSSQDTTEQKADESAQ